MEPEAASERRMRGVNTTKERPILMCADMVRATLDGRKTQTRRVLKAQPQTAQMISSDMASLCYPGMLHRHCPNGSPGDRLWVRETFAMIPEVTYRADDHGQGHDDLPPGDKWSPSIFMPHRCSRLTLEIVSVRVERVQDISEEDAQSEGVGPVIRKTIHNWKPHQLEFSLLWDSLNLKRGFGWDKNPWVWVIEFRKL